MGPGPEGAGGPPFHAQLPGHAEIVWFNGSGPSTISSSSDFRVPVDSLVHATSQEPPGPMRRQR
jgi:hypothetical protein